MAQFKILIVEDEAVIALDLEKRLQQMGYHVIGSVGDSDAALQKIEATPPDAVLMDIHLKGSRDGIETAEEIRTRYEIPVIYVTAYADNATLQRAKVTQPFGYLLKPIRELELRATIEMAIHKHRADSHLREQANIDALTGLYNRRYLDQTLPREFHRAQRVSSNLSLAMLDIDHLKMINDTYGHDAGDYIIRYVATSVQVALRKSDLVCRYGGDEIAILMPDTPLNFATQKMETIITQICAKAVRIEEIELKVTVSMGVATAPDHAQNADELLRIADQALYLSKRSGRNKLSVV